jgi:hypothetical protein
MALYVVSLEEKRVGKFVFRAAGDEEAQQIAEEITDSLMEEFRERALLPPTMTVREASEGDERMPVGRLLTLAPTLKEAN